MPAPPFDGLDEAVERHLGFLPAVHGMRASTRHDVRHRRYRFAGARFWLTLAQWWGIADGHSELEVCIGEAADGGFGLRHLLRHIPGLSQRARMFLEAFRTPDCPDEYDFVIAGIADILRLHMADFLDQRPDAMARLDSLREVPPPDDPRQVTDDEANDY